MDNEFTERFSSYTNVQLLKILEEAKEYQPKAVEAAKNILSNRVVTESEINTAKNEMEEIRLHKRTKNEQSEKIFKDVANVLETIAKPTETIDIKRWIYVLCLGLTVQYLWIAVPTIKSLVTFFNCEACNFSSKEIFDLITLLFGPILIYLLLTKDKWGWILTLGSSIVLILSQILFIYIILKYKGISPESPVPHFLSFFLNVSFLIFLLKSYVKEEFKIKRSTVVRTFSVTIIVTICYYLLVYVTSN